MKKSIIISAISFLVLFTSSNLFSQSGHFVSGYIINNSSDTIKGYIKDLERVEMSEVIVFSDSADGSNSKNFKPSDISTFSIKNRLYKSFEVVLPNRNDSTRFFRFLLLEVKGSASLYSLHVKNDKSVVYFYVQKGSNSIVYLPYGIKNVKIEEKTNFNNNVYFREKVDTRYIGMCRILFSDCQNSPINYNQMKYSLKDISNAIKLYNNDCGNSSEKTEQYTDESKRNIRFGAKVSYLSLSFEPIFTSSIDGNLFTNSFGLGVAGFLETDLTRRIFTSVQLGFSKFSAQESWIYHISGQKEDVSLSFYNVDASLSFAYRIGNSDLQPFIQSGVVAKYMFGQNNKIDRAGGSESFIMKNGIYELGLAFGCNIGGGIILKKVKFSPQISCFYQPSMYLGGPYVLATQHVFGISVGGCF